ncbi:hypothetical protein CRYUN_Cryun28dG0027100 [Craigia yunnanensis]
MSNQTIPLDIVYGILSQLPVKALLRFKSVSKEWFCLINDPYFIKLHLRQSMKTYRNNLNIILKENASGKLFSADFDYVNLDNPRELNHPIKRRPGEELDDDYDNTEVDTRVVEYIDGDYKVLPDQPVELPQLQQLTFYGFGYDSINDDYKLVRIVQKIDVSRSLPLISEVKAYCLKTNTWRKGEVIPNYYFHKSWRTSGWFLCGALHWLGVKERVEERKSECSECLNSSVIAFDVETEKYHIIELLDNMKRETYNMALGALGGCLCMITISLDSEVIVWMMKDYGVKESWTMLYSFRGDIITAAFFTASSLFQKL